MPTEHRPALKVARERVVLISVETPDDERRGEPPLEEFALLADAAGAEVVGQLVQRRRRPEAASYLGKGKVEELAALCAELRADTVAADDDLKPRQARALETAVDRKVVDRSEVILDIFAQRARTRQAQAQVEVAQLEYALPRLKRLWTHLERYKGGIGMRGPGERQIEVDRRLLRRRLQDLKEELTVIDARRLRQMERRTELYTASLVGYTNAGKSTLLAALTGADAYIADQLFATLDTQTRVWAVAGGPKLLLSDTVGFIRKLPHHLIASFRATLEETIHADLLLHVADLSHPNAAGQIEAVAEVLAALGCAATPVLFVFNKIDRPHDGALRAALERRHPAHVAVSARTGAGLDALRAALVARMRARQALLEVEDHVGNGRLWSFLEQHGVVLARHYEGEVARFEVRLDPAHLGELRRRTHGRVELRAP